MRSIQFMTRILFLLLIPVCFIWGQRDRDRWQQPERIIDTVGVKPGMVIGEAGAGEGYFTFKLAPQVGEQGMIYANDINRSALRKLEKRATQEGIENIKIIVGKVTDPLFPNGELDMLIMVYVFHDLTKPLPFLENIKEDLKPGAPLVMVEGDPDKYYGEGHFYSREQVVEMVTSVGYELVRTETFLPRDTIFIFKFNTDNRSQSDD
ncbi:class I SAM-dependent methyltransferase [Candidatus Neomarinimicrobiota bacterium]